MIANGDAHSYKSLVNNEKAFELSEDEEEEPETKNKQKIFNVKTKAVQGVTLNVFT